MDAAASQCRPIWIYTYSVAGKASASAQLPENPSPNVFGPGAESTWSNTPTVTYQPVLGDRFTKSLLQPVPPAAIFQLLQGGWPADLLLRTVVGSINRLRNNSLGMAADADFGQMVEAFSRIQRSGGLGIRVEPRKNGSAGVIVLRQGDPSPGLLEDGRQVRQLLGIEEGIGEFEITYGLIPRNRREVAILSRSMLEIIPELGHGVELPATHVADSRATPGRRRAGDAPATALVRIRSGTAARGALKRVTDALRKPATHPVFREDRVRFRNARNARCARTGCRTAFSANLQAASW